MIAVKAAAQGENNRRFINDATGSLLQKSQNGHVEQQPVVQGNVLGQLGNRQHSQQFTGDQGNQR